MSPTCPFCDVRQPEPVTSSRETLGHRPESEREGSRHSSIYGSMYRSFVAPWMNEQVRSNLEISSRIRKGNGREQRTSIYGNETVLRK